MKIYQFHKSERDQNNVLWVMALHENDAKDYAAIHATKRKHRHPWVPLFDEFAEREMPAFNNLTALQEMGVDAVIRYQCTYCGSTEVFSDAYASMNDPDDVRTYDASHCESCEGECSTELVATELKTGKEVKL